MQFHYTARHFREKGEEYGKTFQGIILCPDDNGNRNNSNKIYLLRRENFKKIDILRNK